MRTWYASKLSDNLSRTPEGYIVAHRVPIARTGSQEYLGREIEDGEDGRFGLDPDQFYTVYREEDEVFHPHAIASFEGKTFTLQHPDEHLTVHTDADHNMGHVQHVERGEPFANGDIPLVADIVVKHPLAIRAIENGTRDISCGYGSQYERKDGTDDFRQVRIAGNHVALVTKGRAGRDVRINDETNKPRETYTVKSKSDLIELGLYHAAKSATTPEEFGRAFRVVSDAMPDKDKEDMDDKKMKDKKMKDEGADKMDQILALLHKMVDGTNKDDDDELTADADADMDDEEMEEGKKKKADMDDEDTEAVMVLDPDERGENPVADKKMKDAALKAHLALKSVVAKSNDSAAKKAWSKTYWKLKGGTKSNDAYVRVAKAALAKSAEAESMKEAQDGFKLAQEMSKAARTEFRAKSR